MPISLTALLIIIGATLSWSGLDTLRKLLASRIKPIPLVILLTLGQIPIFLAWVAIEGSPTFSLRYFQYGLTAVVVNIIANLMFVNAVRISPFSLTIPFLSLTPVFATILAIPMLGEIPTIPQVVGILVAVLGAFNLNVAGGDGVGFRTMWRAFTKERGSVLMTGVAILWSLNSSVDKLAIAQSSVAFHALMQCVGIAFGLLLFSMFKDRFSELTKARPHLILIIGAIAFCAAGLSLEFTAIQMVPIRMVAIIKRVVELTMAVTIGRLIFKEEVTLRKLIAIAMMAIGIVIILR
ncbi:MAG: DMT family transporter [candidate division KSB1 bacterium]|nr:DMT family transporter [candidate division KSB1 bacterium]MDZ7301605.1 DMT family transporter [candidate division KSB1 bacterium]MDZ7310979.1 DMT family transporter [candidate division KSB1 bacterium]